MGIDAAPTWDDLRVLLAVHRHRSFLAAGKALGVSTSTAARRIEALEGSLNRALVHRSSGGTFVEPDALELVALAEQLELGLRAVRRDEALGGAGSPDEHALAGTVRFSMGEGFVRPVTQVLSALRRMHPALHLELISETRLVDLARREADIGIRKGKASSPVLVERSVGRLHFGLYAAQSYVDRRLRGGALKLSDLERHDFVGLEGELAKLPHMRWLTGKGARRFVFRSNSDAALEEAACQGMGICALADAAARSRPELMRLTFDAELPSSPVYLAFHRELRQVPRVRLVIDALDAALREGLR
jgi:DNA-binding transcriptional LysR family regulator